MLLGTAGSLEHACLRAGRSISLISEQSGSQWCDLEEGNLTRLRVELVAMAIGKTTVSDVLRSFVLPQLQVSSASTVNFAST